MKQVLLACGSPAHWREGESQPYEEALRAAGIEPILLSPGDAIPGGASGLLLMGGSDVNPARYGEARQAGTDEPDDTRDELECALIADAISRDLPVLAICRGLQILNVQQGGTLVQHLDSTARHRTSATPAHSIEIVPGTRLSAIAADSPTWDVNSRHHQAIVRLADGLRVSARDVENGVIEAVERPDKHFILGVQWHPENMWATDARQAALFQAFAASLKSA